MITVRFTNIFKNVRIQMTEEAVARLRNGEKLMSVLTEQQKTVLDEGFIINRMKGTRVPWSEIWAINDANRGIVWAGDPYERPVRYSV